MTDLKTISASGVDLYVDDFGVHVITHYRHDPDSDWMAVHEDMPVARYLRTDDGLEHDAGPNPAVKFIDRGDA